MQLHGYFVLKMYEKNLNIEKYNSFRAEIFEKWLNGFRA